MLRPRGEVPFYPRGEGPFFLGDLPGERGDTLFFYAERSYESVR